MEDKELKCKDCEKQFTFSAGEQIYFTDRQLAPPRRCKPCRLNKKRQQQTEDSTYN